VEEYQSLQVILHMVLLAAVVPVVPVLLDQQLQVLWQHLGLKVVVV
tara:strand:+ start:84 stop:221 length:138 start_codon:yes stop_codon:yes gene_type:complete